MTKQELLAKVQALPDDITFLLSSDEEGNSYRDADLDVKAQKAFDDGYEWHLIDAQEVAMYEEEGHNLTDVVVFW